MLFRINNCSAYFSRSQFTFLPKSSPKNLSSKKLEKQKATMKEKFSQFPFTYRHGCSNVSLVSVFGCRENIGTRKETMELLQEWSYRDQEILRKDNDESDEIAEQFQCCAVDKSRTTKRGKDLSSEKYGLWRQDRKNRTARLEKQLKARRELDELIEEQLSKFHFHYVQDMVPTKLKDIPQLLMPKWSSPNELASIAWLGDWRPSSILDIARGLVRSSYFSSSTSGKSNIMHILLQLIHEIRIEEAVLDEEMAEIQATCILHLPFDQMKSRDGGNALASVQSEFKKIERVITKANHLRFKALELMLMKVLSQTDAAQFLVAFEGIQDVIHRFSSRQMVEKGPVTVSIKALGSS